MPIHFYTNKQFYFKQFSLAEVQNLNAKNISISSYSVNQTVLFQTIQFSIQKQFHFKQFSLALILSLNVKAALFQEIQFSIGTQLSSIWPIDRTLSGSTTLGQGGTPLPQSSSITGTSLSDCLMSQSGHSLGGSPSLLKRSSLCILHPSRL